MELGNQSPRRRSQPGCPARRGSADSWTAAPWGGSGTRGAAGFSLVEVIVAMGLLAGVLVAVAGMFVFGQRQVQSGRSSTEALAVARAMMEEMQGLGFHQTHALFEEASCDPGADTTCTVDTATNPNATRWQTLLEEGLEDVRAEVRFEALGGGPLGAARALRIQVTVFWTEGDRPRQLAVMTVRS